MFCCIVLGHKYFLISLYLGLSRLRHSTKPDNLSLVPRTHMCKERTDVRYGMYVPLDVLTKEINVILKISIIGDVA